MIQLFKEYVTRDYISKRLGTLKTQHSAEFRSKYRRGLSEFRIAVFAIAIMVAVSVWVLLGNNISGMNKACAILIAFVITYFASFPLLYSDMVAIVTTYLRKLDQENKIEFCKHFGFKICKEDYSENRYYSVYGYIIPIIDEKE